MGNDCLLVGRSKAASPGEISLAGFTKARRPTLLTRASGWLLACHRECLLAGAPTGGQTRARSRVGQPRQRRHSTWAGEASGGFPGAWCSWVADHFDWTRCTPCSNDASTAVRRAGALLNPQHQSHGNLAESRAMLAPLARLALSRCGAAVLSGAGCAFWLVQDVVWMVLPPPLTRTRAAAGSRLSDAVRAQCSSAQVR